MSLETLETLDALEMIETLDSKTRLDQHSVPDVAGDFGLSLTHRTPAHLRLRQISLATHTC